MITIFLVGLSVIYSSLASAQIKKEVDPRYLAYLAFQEKDKDARQQLLSNDELSKKVFEEALHGGDTRIINALIEKKPYLLTTPVGNYNSSPLEEALRHDNYAAAQILLKKGADPEFTVDKPRSIIRKYYSLLDPSDRTMVKTLKGKFFDIVRTTTPLQSMQRKVSERDTTIKEISDKIKQEKNVERKAELESRKRMLESQKEVEQNLLKQMEEARERKPLRLFFKGYEGFAPRKTVEPTLLDRIKKGLNLSNRSQINKNVHKPYSIFPYCRKKNSSN